MDRIEQIKEIITNPVRFFKTLKEESLGSIYLFYFVLFSIYTVMSLLVSVTLYTFIGSMSLLLVGEAQMFGMIGNVFFSILTYMLSLGLIFLIIGLYHVYLMIFGANESFARTFQLVTYSSVPTYLFGWIPLLGFFTFIWSLILIIIGSQRTHKLSLAKAIIAFVVVPIVLVFILFGIIISAILLFAIALY